MKKILRKSYLLLIAIALILNMGIVSKQVKATDPSIPEKPDFTVENIRFFQEFNGVKDALVGTVCNRGLWESGSNYTIKFSSNSGFVNVAGINLSVNQCYDFVRNINIDPKLAYNDGNYTFTITADSSNVINETNEGNNEMSKIIYVDLSSNNLPDLKVENIEYYKDFNSAKEVIRATICNRGSSNVTNSYLETRYTTDAGSATSWLNSVSINANTCFFDYVFASSMNIKEDKNYSITVQTDTHNNIAESNETNNTYTKTVYVDLDTNNLPDLKVENLNFYTSFNSQKDVLVASICNRGTATAASTYQTRFSTSNGVYSVAEWNGSNIVAGSCRDVIKAANTIIGNDDTYQIIVDVDSSNNIAESDEHNNSLVKSLYIDLTNSKPDLKVEDLSFYQNANGYKDAIVAKVCNRGGADVKYNSTLSFATSKGTAYQTVGNPININNCIDVTTSVNSIASTDGNYSFTAKVDTSNNIDESNESNNNYSETIYVTLANSPTYDLQLNDIDFVQNDNGKKDVIRAVICNRGTKVFDKSYYTEFSNNSNSVGSGVAWNGNSIGIDACQTITLYASNLKIYQDGNYSITVKADSTNLTQESNESNNSLTENLYIDLANSGNPNSPDLVVDKIAFNKSYDNFNNVITALICNRSNYAISNKNVETYFGANWKSNTHLYGNLNLNASSCYTSFIQASYLNIYNSGYYNVTVKADNTNIIPEANEGNNEKTTQVYVDLNNSSLTDLTVDSIMVSPYNKKAIKASICNKGSNTVNNANIHISYEGPSTSVVRSLYINSLSGCMDTYIDVADLKITTMGYYNIKVTVDSNNELDESNENNNWLQNQLYIDVNGSNNEGSGNTPLPPASYSDHVMTSFAGYKNPFWDTQLGTQEGDSAAELYRRNVLTGYSDGSFKGSRLVQRAEIIKFLLKTRYGTIEEVQNNYRFWDVITGEWYVKYVTKAVNLGIISGYYDGSFRPGKFVNTAEFLKMMTLTFGLEQNLPYYYNDVNQYDWYAKYAGIAQKYNLFPNRTNGQLLPSKELTRKEVAIAIYNYLKSR